MAESNNPAMAEQHKPNWTALAGAWRAGAASSDLGDIDDRYRGDHDLWSTALDSATNASAFGRSWQDYRRCVEAWMSHGLPYDDARDRVMDDWEMGRREPVESPGPAL